VEAGEWIGERWMSGSVGRNGGLGEWRGAELVDLVREAEVEGLDAIRSK